MTFAEYILAAYQCKKVRLCLPSYYPGHDEVIEGLLVRGGPDHLELHEESTLYQTPVYSRIVNIAHIQSVIPVLEAKL